MGLNLLGEKKVRRLRELTGLNIDQAVTSSHVESGRWWWFRVIEEDSHWHGWYDRETGSWSENHDMHDPHWSSCADVPGGLPERSFGPPEEPIATTGPLVPRGTP